MRGTRSGRWTIAVGVALLVATAATPAVAVLPTPSATLWTRPTGADARALGLADGGVVTETCNGNSAVMGIPFASAFSAGGVSAWQVVHPGRGGCGLAVDAGSVTYVATDTGMEARDRAGKQLWIQSTGQIVGRDVRPVIGRDGNIYAPASTGQNTITLFRYARANGTPTALRTYPDVIALAAYDGGLIVWKPDTVEYLTYDGTVAHEYPTQPQVTYYGSPTYPYSTSAAVAPGGRMFIAGYSADCHSADNKLSVLAFTPSGLAWSYTVPAPPAPCPVLGTSATPDGGVIISETYDFRTDYLSVARSSSSSTAGTARWTLPDPSPTSRRVDVNDPTPHVDTAGTVTLVYRRFEACQASGDQTCYRVHVEFVKQDSATRHPRAAIDIGDPSHTRGYWLSDVGASRDRLFFTTRRHDDVDASVSAVAVPGLTDDYAQASAYGASTPSTPPAPCTAPKKTGSTIRLLPDRVHKNSEEYIDMNARVTRSAVIGVPDKLVTFRVACGPNAGKTRKTRTDSRGLATFFYKGHGPGTDAVVASYTDAKGHSVRDTSSISWSAPVDPCTVKSSSTSKRLAAAIQCAIKLTVLEAKCGTAVSGFIFAAPKLLKLARGARGLLDLKKLDARDVPAGEVYNLIVRTKPLPHAPKGLQTAKQILDRIGRAKKVYTLMQIFSDLRDAWSHTAHDELMLDITKVLGLDPCVEAMTAGLE